MSLARSVSALLVFACAAAVAFACSSSPASTAASASSAPPVAPALPAQPAGSEEPDAPVAPAPASAPAVADAAPELDAATAPDGSPPDSGILGTGGKGGLACTRMDDLGGGRKSCVAKVGSVELAIAIGTSSAAAVGVPLRLGLFVHGDGAADHIDNTALKAMLPWADAVHGLAVSARAPNGCSWWLAPSYDCSGSEAPGDNANENAPALATALEAVSHAYDLRTDGMRYYSASGGSIFLTSEWIPMHGGSHPGVFALMCGGVVSGVPYAWDTSDAALRAKSATWFTYGAEDGLRPQIEQTTASYLAKGFAVTTKVIPNQGHCTFDVHGEAMAIWSANP